MNWARRKRFDVYGPDPNRRRWAVLGGRGAPPHPPHLSVWIALARHLPDVRMDKVIRVRQQLDDQAYDVPVALNIALDVAIGDLEEQPVFLAPDQN